MKQTENNREIVERILDSIAVHIDDKAAIETARKLILGDLKRHEESEAEFTSATGGECVCTWWFGCRTTNAPMLREEPSASHHHPAHGMTAPSGGASERVVVGVGYGHCYFIGSCWICYECECH